MNKFQLYLFTLFLILPVTACQNGNKRREDFDNKSYINDFELLQKNSKNDTSIKIISPEAIIEPVNNDIEIFDSLIEIKNKNGHDILIKSGNTTLDNFTNLIRVYNKVNISLLDTKNSFINTNSFEWNLSTSTINLNNPLYINLNNTKINSSHGYYNIDSSQLRLNNTIFNRNIFNESGVELYHVRIIADKAKWKQDNNSLEFSSNNKQVETKIDFLYTK